MSFRSFHPRSALIPCRQGIAQGHHCWRVQYHFGREVHHPEWYVLISSSYVERTALTLGAILRGDLRRSTAGQHVVISMGRYCNIGEGSIIRPPGKMYKG
jgi:hypothetical protein